MRTPIPSGQVKLFVDASQAGYENILEQLVIIPTVSMDPAHGEDIREGAKFAVSFLNNIGFTTHLIETSGHPLVAGELVGKADWPTVLIYNHMDVQPADPKEWDFSPFSFVNVREEGRYFGRGTADDKGPALAVLFAVLGALQQRLPLNFQVIWDFEEEIGSPSFAEGLYKNHFTVKPQSVLVSDGLWISKEIPSFEYGHRGCVGFSLVLETGKHDVHSGITGGLARNPLLELIEIIARCYKYKDGFVTIPGFYDKVQWLFSDRELIELCRHFDIQGFMDAYGLHSMRSNDTEVAVRATKLLPTLEVHGIVGGHTGPGIKTIVPQRAEAKLSIRIVPGQTVAGVSSLVRDFIRSLNPDVQIEFETGLEPYREAPRGPYFKALEIAVRNALGKSLASDLSGGSDGAFSTMHKHFGVPIVSFGLCLPEHNYHGPNENFEWKQARAGMAVFMEYFNQIVGIPKEDSRPKQPGGPS